MVKPAKKIEPSKNLNRKPPKAGDTYKVSSDIDVADVDGDGISDITYTHTVLKNDQHFVDATVVWYGLAPPVMSQFVEILAGAGIVNNEVLETTKFNVVVKHWKGLTQALGKINKLGDDLAVSIGEKIDV